MGAQCPTNYNPADFYVQVLAIVPGREVESRERIGKICDSFATSKVARDMEQLLAAKAQTQALEQPENGYTYKATWFMQFRAVLWRSWLSVLKEPLLVKVRLIQTTVSMDGFGGISLQVSNTLPLSSSLQMVAVLIGLIFLGQQLTQVGVMNINGAIFLFLTNMTFQNVFATINVSLLRLGFLFAQHYFLSPFISRRFSPRSCLCLCGKLEVAFIVVTPTFWARP